jgi:5'(3')-deoxyribonucleotidase
VAELMVDIDDVIFPTMQSIHDLAREAELHDGTAPMRWKGWESYNCDEQDYWDIWSEFALKGGYLNTEPIPEAVEALRWLLWEGHQIHLVTARGFMAHAEDIRAWTPEWLEEFGIPHHTLTFARDKVKAQYDLGVRFDFAIDDSPKNVEALTAAGVRAYLLDHQHNEDHESDQRVSSLWEWAFIIEKERVA